MEVAERRDKTPIKELFSDVYDVLPQHLREQEAEFLAHLEKYPEPAGGH